MEVLEKKAPWLKLYGFIGRLDVAEEINAGLELGREELSECKCKREKILRNPERRGHPLWDDIKDLTTWAAGKPKQLMERT